MRLQTKKKGYKKKGICSFKVLLHFLSLTPLGSRGWFFVLLILANNSIDYIKNFSSKWSFHTALLQKSTADQIFSIHIKTPRRNSRPENRKQKAEAK